jgi:elongation factor P
MISTNEFKNGAAIILDGELYTIVEFQHVKPGKGGAFVRTKLRNMKLGTVISKTFRAGEKVQDAFIEQKNLQFTYNAGDMYHFMCQDTYEEIMIPEEIMGDAVKYMKDHMKLSVSMHEGKVLGVNLPTFVKLKITSTEPGVRGDTVKAGTKSAKTETGLIVSVPLFINNGDVIKVDTRTGGYIERA